MSTTDLCNDKTIRQFITQSLRLAVTTFPTQYLPWPVRLRIYCCPSGKPILSKTGIVNKCPDVSIARIMWPQLLSMG